MNRETRIVIEPSGSRLKRRSWVWFIECRNWAMVRADPVTGREAHRVYGIWAETKRGYSRNAVVAEQSARTWLDEQALKQRLKQEKIQAEIDKVTERERSQKIIYIEEQ